MHKLVISKLAKADMVQIGDYIRQELANPKAALRMMQKLKETMLPLREFPEMGTPLPAVEKHIIPYRYLVCGNYMVFYHFSPDAVYIDRVLYGRRDYMALLFGDRISDEE